MKKIVCLLAVLGLAAGCSKEEHDGGPSGGALRIGQVALSADDAETEWNGVSLGLSVVASGGTLETGKTGFNVRLDYEGGTWTPEAPVRWTDDAEGTVCDLIAYAPYAASVTDPSAFPLSVETDQRAEGAPEKNDFLYGRTTVTKTGDTPANLVLDHALSRLVFQVVFDGDYAGTPGIEGLTLSLKNGGTIDLNDGTVSVSGDATAWQPCLWPTAPSGVSQLYELTVPPQTVTEETPFLSFSVDDRHFEKSLSAVFEPGLCYTYRLRIGRDSEPVLLALSSMTIDEWRQEAVQLPDAEIDYGEYGVGDLWPDASNPVAFVVRAKEKHRPGLMVTVANTLGTPFKTGGGLFNTLDYTDALGAVRKAASSLTDGRTNLQTLELCLNEANGNTVVWEELPVFDFCRSLGPDWFIPAADEWQALLDQIDPEVWEDLLTRYWNHTLKWYKPLPDFKNTSYVYTSTMGEGSRGLTFTRAGILSETKTAVTGSGFSLSVDAMSYSVIAFRYF